MNVGIIGLGKMGEAILRGLLKSRNYRVYFNEIRQERIEEVQKRYSQIKHLDLQQLVDTSEIIIFAVKPQDLASLLQKLEVFLKREKLFITICAGISISFIRRFLKKARIIRAMPNMGALIGHSFTVVAKGEKVTPEDMERAKRIFSTFGKVREVKEDLIDAVTAISGSGPAYFGYFIKCLEEAGKEIGLSEMTSELVLECFHTTSRIMKELKINSQELIDRVASKGGTTEACLKLWEEEKFSELIKKGIRKAQERAKELGK